MDQAVVYHYWQDGGTVPAYRDMENPVVVSIATFRHAHPDAPVYVADVSDRPNEWGDYPAALGFKVFHQAPAIPVPFDGLNIQRSTYKYCSSVFDVTSVADRVPENTVVFADSDLFFLKPVLPLRAGGLFHCRPGFVGFYYYDKRSQATRKFLGLWKRCILRALVDRAFRKNVTDHYRVKGFINQESVFVYLCDVADLSGSVRFLSAAEHCLEPREPGDLPMFHFTSHYFGHSRGMAAYHVRELFRGVVDVLGADRVREVFGRGAEGGGRVAFQERASLAVR